MVQAGQAHDLLEGVEEVVLHAVEELVEVVFHARDVVPRTREEEVVGV